MGRAAPPAALETAPPADAAVDAVVPLAAAPPVAIDSADEGSPASPQTAATAALVGLFGLASIYTLYVARALLLPVLLAMLLSFILWPIVRGLKRWGVPEGVGALLVLAGLAAAVGWGGYELSAPAATWLQEAPQTFRRIEARVRVVKETVQDMSQATDQMEKLTSVGDAPRVVALQGPGLGATLLTGTWNVAAAAGIVLILTYFLLASGDLFLRKLIGVLPTFRDKKRVVAMSREIQDSVSAYLFTVSLINAGVGVCVGLSMTVLGMPNPMLWGALAAVLNFVPYIGAAAGIGIVGCVALATFDRLADAVAAPGMYLLLTTVEAYFVTPMIFSRRFTLNPVIVLLGLLFWGWIWGIPGALLAVPLLVTLRILCDYIPSLHVLGEFLGR